MQHRNVLPPGPADPWRLHHGIGVLAVALFVLGMIGFAAWMIRDAYRLTWDHAIATAEDLAAAIDHDIARNIELYDLSLQAVA